MGAENSEVFPVGSVAVAVMNSPTGTGATKVLVAKLTSPLASVVAMVEPRNTFPSPCVPLEAPLTSLSHTGLAKNSMVNSVSGVLFKLQSILTLAPSLVAAVTFGKFCRSFAPVSTSAKSLGVTPFETRSIPRVLLEKIEFDKIALLSLANPPPPPAITTPARLKAIILPAPFAVPPIVLRLPSILIP